MISLLTPVTGLGEAATFLVGLLRNESPVLLVSRTCVMFAWLYALAGIWKYRAYPHANQALAGALAMVLISGCLIFDMGIEPDVLLFFAAMAQLVLALTFTQLFGLMRRVTPKECGECPIRRGVMADATVSVEEEFLQSLELTHQASTLSRFYMRTVIGATSLGILVLFVQYLCRAGA